MYYCWWSTILKQDWLYKNYYNVVLKALKKACNMLKKSNTQFGNNDNEEMIINYLNHKIHDNLMGYFLKQAHDEIIGNNREVLQELDSNKT